MPLRIVTRVAQIQNALVLEGWLTGPEVAEFERVATTLSIPLCIDLAQLAGADAMGVAALQTQRERGATLTNTSPYIELLLRAHVAIISDDDCRDAEDH